MVPRTGLALVALLTGIGFSPAPAPAAPQDPRAPDSTRTVRRLRSAQGSFEATRRRHLPTSRAYRPRTCDAVIGRICFWHDDDPLWDPPPEDERVTRARRDLLRSLELAAAVHPGDRWIVGQRVRYLLEAGDTTAALTAARACHADGWWCRALEGFVWHALGDDGAAEAAFEVALRLSPDSIRCAWTDLSDIGGPGPERSGPTTCGEPPDAYARFWWLADPLYSVPGNERRAEHHARLVMVRLLARAALPSGMRWGRDQEEIILRYGWSVGWSRAFSGRSASVFIIGHHRRGSRHFLPRGGIVDDPSTAASNAWDLDAFRPWTRYAPVYATAFGRLLPEFSLFARGDSAVLVAAFRAAVLDTGQAPRGPFAVAVTYQEDQAAPLLVRADTIPAGGTARLLLTVPRRGGVVSAEALSRTDSLAGRARQWLPVDAALPPGRPSVALLLVEGTAALPSSLPAAAAVARPSSAFAPGDPISVYWETAEFPLGSTRDVSLTVIRESGSVLRRAASWLGLASMERTEVTLGWEEGDPLAGGVPGRSVTFDLPEAREGDYRIRLTARSGAASASTEKVIRVRSERR